MLAFNIQQNWHGFLQCNLSAGREGGGGERRQNGNNENSFAIFANNDYKRIIFRTFIYIPT